MLTSNRYADTLTGGVGADTLNAGQGPDKLTGGAGADAFVFKAMPWNAGHIRDFAVGVDTLDLRPLFAAIGYRGRDPIAEGYLKLQSDGHGGTVVLIDRDGFGAADLWATTITTLDGVTPSSLRPSDWLFN
ncbi:type I secretion C-terminal target domain-containing protein [Phenylobacterium sp.]|uniref:type I secretion C-terminal target domain-containing protein n=1 Tax=Phenylobacterium sp. TaxID=1871053 RepID=UPI00286DC6FE|nr:type I secretion C-terminal target domain-containing protein [Phenylobacterium sp.]